MNTEGKCQGVRILPLILCRQSIMLGDNGEALVRNSSYFPMAKMSAVDVDVIALLKYVLSYLCASQHLGIMLRVGKAMTMYAYIDASCGVHQRSGK